MESRLGVVIVILLLVFLLDDDPSNIEAVNKMAEKEGLSNKIRALQAKV